MNSGVPGTGYGTAGELNGAGPYTERVDSVAASAPDIVVVSGGRFDYTGDSSAREVSKAITDTFAGLRAGLPNARIIATSAIWSSGAAPERLAEISEEIRIAVLAVDGFYLDVGQPLAGEGDLVAPDGVVPTDAGYAALYESISAALTPVLASK